MSGRPETFPEDTGLARERTALAWTRTGLSFGVAGAVLLRLLHGADAVVLGLSAALVGLGCVAWTWGWRGPGVPPAVETRLGRAAVRTLALGTGLVAAVAILVGLLRAGA